MDKNLPSEAEGKVAEALGTFQEVQRILAKFPIRRWSFPPEVTPLEQIQPDGSKPPTLEAAEKLVLETVRLVGRLAELSVRFPELLNVLARQMPAWPVMHFKREGVGGDFWHVRRHLQLAEEYPLDTSHGARWHPSSATGQYLSRWVDRIHCFRLDTVRAQQGTKPVSRASTMALFNGSPPGGRRQLRSEQESLLQVVIRMPPLTKATSNEWSRQVLVPLIMLWDAGSDEASCKEPALKAIWRQKGVKSRATFKSRLLTKVRQTLRSLARPA